VLAPETPQQEHDAVHALGAFAKLVEDNRTKSIAIRMLHQALEALEAKNLRAASTVINRIFQRVTMQVQSQSAGGGATQDSLCAFLAGLALSSSPSVNMTACFLSSSRSALQLFRHQRPAVRRAALDIMGAMLGWQHAGARESSLDQSPAMGIIRIIMEVAARDKDATVRSKALAALESHASRVVLLLHEVGDSAQVSSNIAGCIAARLSDRSVSVRKRAVHLLAAFTAASLPDAFMHQLNEHIAPVVCTLLQLPHDNSLYSGNFTTELANCLLALIKHTRDGHLTKRLIELHRTATDDATRAVVRRSLVAMLLPANVAVLAPTAGPLVELLGICSRSQAEEMKVVLQSAVSGDVQLQGRATRVAAALTATAQNSMSLLGGDGPPKDLARTLIGTVWFTGQCIYSRIEISRT